MRIAIIQNTLSVYNIPLFDLIAQDGHEVTLFTVYSEMDKWEIAKAGEDAGIAFDHRVFCEGRNRFAGRVRPVIGLVKAVEAYSPNVIFIDGLASMPTSIYLLLRRPGRIPVVWWSLGRTPSRKNDARAWVSDLVQGWCARRCSAVLSYGSYAAAFFQGLGVDAKCIVTGCNTVDERVVARDMLMQADETSRLRIELGGNTLRFIVFCGTIRENKGVDTLLKAFSAISPEYPNVRLLIIGGGQGFEAMLRLSRDMGLSSSVIFVGEQRKLLTAYMMLGEFVVLPGLGGLAINHAFAHGLPVISGSADGMEQDLVRNGETGELLEVADEQSIAQSMSVFLREPAKTKVLGDNASRLIYGEFSLAEYARRVITAAELARRRCNHMNRRPE